MTIETDVLVIGCGIAGAAAALRLAQDGQRQVLVVTRTADPQETNTRYAQGGIVSRGEGDSPELLTRDVLAAGAGLSL
ncbi:MAG: FAD-dependent oxidoreductase, partial [Anaerolineae bacterium]